MTRRHFITWAILLASSARAQVSKQGHKWVYVTPPVKVEVVNLSATTMYVTWSI